MLKEIARIPAEGVETREGATSAMFGLDSGHLMVSLDPEGDPLGDEALRLCAATGATTLRLPGVGGADARLAPVTTLPAAVALTATLALAAGHDVDHPSWTDAYYRTARSTTGAPAWMPTTRPSGAPREHPPGRLRRDRAEHHLSIRLGVVGCGSVFWTPYMGLIERLRGQDRVEVTAVYDADPDKRRAAAERLELDPELREDVAVCAHPEVDVVLVLTSMTEHGRLARAALEAGKHVLVEKPVATSLAEAEEVLAAAEESPGLLVCAPHILLSPTYRAMHTRVRAGHIGGLLTARGRYGWAGPDWNRWYYQPGGGALFDLGVYNVTSLCGFFGPARRVTAMTGVAIPERVGNGEPMRVEAEDNAHVLIDFGDARFAVGTTGFTMQSYRSPCLELYGTHGVLQMLGDDWAPEGYELWRNSRRTSSAGTGDEAAWQLHPESDPTWSWTEGLRHLIDCLETGTEPVTRPEHAYHALEIMLAAQAAGRDGRARAIASDFPEPELARLSGSHARTHDPRSAA